MSNDLFRRCLEIHADADGSSEIRLHGSFDRIAATVHPGVGGSAILDISCAPYGTDGEEHWVAWSIGETMTKAGAGLPAGIVSIRLRAITAEATAYVALLK